MKNTISGNEARGFMKIIVDADTDTVIGVHMIGPESAEILQVNTVLLATLLYLLTQSYNCRVEVRNLQRSIDVPEVDFCHTVSYLFRCPMFWKYT